MVVEVFEDWCCDEDCSIVEGEDDVEVFGCLIGILFFEELWDGYIGDVLGDVGVELGEDECYLELLCLLLVGDGVCGEWRCGEGGEYGIYGVGGYYCFLVLVGCGYGSVVVGCVWFLGGCGG